MVAYTFDPTGTSRDHSGGDESVVEQYSIVATDANGNSNASAEVLDILITDTNPTANDDARSISEGTPAIAGNVVGTASSATGDVSDTLVDSNANPVTDVDFGGTDGTVGTGLAGNYGSIVISSVGVYTYTLDNTSSDVQGLKGSESLTDVFTYTITDGDGDTDTASLTVTINGVDDPLPTINVVDNNGSATGEHSVEEATGSGSTVMSTMNITASAGVAALTIAGQDVTNASTSTPSSYVTVNGSEGTLIVTNFNAGTFSFGSFNASTISYSYTEDGNNESHSGGEILDNFAIAITDNEGDTASDSLGIQILDTAPTAAIDSGSVTEDAASNTATGDVTTNDSQGADTAISVTGIDFGGAQAVNTPFSSSHGTLDLNADGTYTYTLDNGDSAVNALNSSQTLVEIFTYTIADTDGDASTSTLAITINGVNETVITSTTTAVNETLTGTSASENFFTDTVLGVSDGATGGEVIDSNGGSDRLIINGDDIPMVAGNGDNEGQGDRQGIELQDWTFANTASNVQGDVVDISDLLEAAGADTSGDGTITAAEATPFIHLSENEGSTTGGVISIDVGGGFTTADRTAINAGGTVTGKGTGDRDLVIFSNDASADLDTAAAAGGYTGTAYSAVESDQTAQIQALLNQNILVIDT